MSKTSLLLHLALILGRFGGRGLKFSHAFILLALPLQSVCICPWINTCRGISAFRTLPHGVMFQTLPLSSISEGSRDETSPGGLSVAWQNMPDNPDDFLYQRHCVSIVFISGLFSLSLQNFSNHFKYTVTSLASHTPQSKERGRPLQKKWISCSQQCLEMCRTYESAAFLIQSNNYPVSEISCVPSHVPYERKCGILGTCQSQGNVTLRPHV